MSVNGCLDDRQRVGNKKIIMIDQDYPVALGAGKRIIGSSDDMTIRLSLDDVNARVTLCRSAKHLKDCLIS